MVNKPMGTFWVLLSLIGCGESPPVCPAGMVTIPAGTFSLGVENPSALWHEMAHETTLSTYCIDQYEYPNQKGALPKAQVTFEDSESLCAAAGKRLCSADEWERACRGSQGHRYTYGDVRDASACNTPIDGTGPGRNAPPLAASGDHVECKSAEGVMDMGGNLSEWVSDPWDGGVEPFRPGATSDPKTWRTVRGGTMWSQTFYGQECASRHGHPMASVGGFSNVDDGLRCCQTPK